jgi:hypothetical protein
MAGLGGFPLVCSGQRMHQSGRERGDRSRLNSNIGPSRFNVGYPVGFPTLLSYALEAEVAIVMHVEGRAA